MQNDAATAVMLGTKLRSFKRPSGLLGFLAISSSGSLTALQWNVCRSVIYSLKSSFLQQFTIYRNDAAAKFCAAQLFEAAFEPSLKGSRRRRKTLVQQHRHKQERSWRQWRNSILTAEAPQRARRKREREGREEKKKKRCANLQCVH